MEVGIIEIIITPEVGGLTDTAAFMGDNVLKTTVMGTVRVIITQVPFAEHGGLIAIGAENISHGQFGFSQDRATPAGSPGAVADGTSTGHQRAAGWSTEG